MIFIAAVFVNNVVLAQFLGICPFLGVSKKVSTAIGMTGALTFVMILATLVTFIIQKSILDPFGIGFMQTITFILVIAALVQMVEIILKKVSPSLYQALGVFLPLITTNCAVLGVAIMVIQKDFNLLQSLVFAASTAIGFGLALTIFAGIREHLELVSVPKGMQGLPYRINHRRTVGHGFHGIFRHCIDDKYGMKSKALLSVALIGLSVACAPHNSLMRKEADAFLKQMGTELQPKQRDAILAAIDGDGKGLEQIRSARNSRPVYPPNVKVTHPSANTRLYTNTETNAVDKPLLIYLHGGGWTIGSLNSCARFCSTVCSQGGASVLAVDYRLSPEHPYPTPLDDCEAAIRLALEKAGDWGCSAKRIILGGDSSGGILP